MSDNLGFDPNLKKAAKEIKAIMRKHNIGGSISLVSKTHSEFLYHIPPWVAIKITADGRGASIKINSEIYPDRDKKMQVAEDTAHFIMANQHTLDNLSGQNNVIGNLLREAWDIVTEESKFTPHVEGVTTEEGLKTPSMDNIESFDKHKAERDDNG